MQKDVVEWDTYTGYLEAPESVNLAARVSGLITAAPFIEGSIVKKGDLLFVIDDRPFKADLDAKLAAQQQAEAQQAIAKVTYDRLLGLQKDRAVSQQDIDNAKANIDQADAAVAGAEGGGGVITAEFGLVQGHVSDRRAHQQQAGDRRQPRERRPGTGDDADDD